MRILYDHQVFSLQDTGGISRYHYELAKALQALPETLPEPLDQPLIEVFMGGNTAVLPFTSLRRPGTHVVSWKTRLKPDYPRYAMNEAMLSLAATFRGRYDIYHPTLNRIMPAVRRRRMVVTQHDCTHERFPELFRNIDAFTRVKRQILSKADAILCVSESSRRDLLHFYDVDEARTHVVHHGFSPLQPLVEPAPVASGGAYILYVGSRAEYKNFTLLLQAFARSGLASEYCLVAVGGGSCTTEEQKRIAELGIAANVRFIPSASDSLLAGLYRNASLLVYPSRYEGFGFPPLEAMSVGCPVLVNRTSSLPEICGDAAFYFHTQNEAELSQVLVATLQDVEALRQKRQAGYRQVQLYSWAKAARSTLEIYAACLAG